MSGPVASWARRARRAGRLATLPAGAVGLAVEGMLRRWRGEEPSVVAADLRRRNADRMRRILGEAKGGALKAGQLLATVEALFPQDPDATWQQALATLPADSPAVPFEDLCPTLVDDLGSDWPARLVELDHRTAAAASIGQVHRGRWHDGRDVAVKIQYPGAAEALRTDLAAVSLTTRLAALVAPGMALPPLVTELRARLVEELDYHREARVQQAFADAYRDDPDVVVPGVVHATEHVLVSQWMDGIPFTALASQVPQAQTDAVATTYVRFMLAGPATAGWLHTDPHPGNFRLLPGGRLGVLDFGSALPMPDGMPRTFGRLISLLRADDPQAILRGLRAEGFVRPGGTVDAEKLRGYLAPFVEPSRHETFAFTPEWLRSQFGRLGDPRKPDFAVALQLTMPPEHLFTHRVWLGIVGVLCNLRATVPVGPIVRRWLPGLEQ